jgi:hypothetical protein
MVSKGDYGRLLEPFPLENNKTACFPKIILLDDVIKPGGEVK